ncbi:MAG: zinc ribbon domain-containing protein [Planctomycetota bacterium]|jgi:hypothetical protein
MAATQIVCTNCGAKYRIPETFKGNRAKCKACGTVIDVAAQRAAEPAQEAGEERPAPAAAKPAAAKPAAARPASARPASTRSSRTAKKADAKPVPSRSRRKPAASDESEDSESGTVRRPRRAGASSGSGRGSSRGSARSSSRRGRAAAEEKQGNKAMLIGGAVLVLALAVVGVIFFMGGDEEPAGEKVAGADSETMNANMADSAAANQAEAPAETPPGEATEGKPAEGEPVEAAGEEKSADPAEASSEETKEPEKAAEPAKETKPARKKGEPITDPSQVFNPKTELDPMPWPADVTDEEKAIIDELISDLATGGRAGIEAKKKLEAMGHKPLAAIFNALREKDYMDSFDSMDAWELNKFMETTTKGANVPFRPVNIGEEVPLETADWNARIVKVWVSFVSHYSSAENWDKLMEKRGVKK